MTAPQLHHALRVVGLERHTLRQRIEAAIVWNPRWKRGVMNAEPAILSPTVVVRLYDLDDLDDALGEPQDRWVAANGCQVRAVVDGDSLHYVGQYLFVSVDVEEDW
jgi:hypothetical protein